ncbi:SDR family oxidoreductase [uncultured Sneathiella sp.]|jgi:NAD(P)-dependent dehydrogenase (short-subunit alcohol dehydrogenase family)|uniref:SDR family oxidoreductase n=1 Tax=uncultured Sneathiella sp. TaxID=879315 RepID=UPI0030DB04D8|tara:strand:- start:1229 stop:1987 length:759 start_codon:yes stop_codon:yes gene_type:complete
MPNNILITGASRRIGRAIALGFAAEGWGIALHYHQSKKDAETLREELNELNARVCLIKADLSDAAAVAGIVPEATANLGPLTCLVNNAAVFDKDTISDATAEGFHHHLNTNLLAPMLLTQSFAKQLPKEEQGNIINIADQRVFNLQPEFTTYTLSKAGLWTLTQTTAMALAPGIRVNAIGPGPTLANSRQTAAQFKQQQQSVPLGYGPAPEEIAEAVLFIVRARSMTGEFICLDGGQHLPIVQNDAKDDAYE